jgi:molybdopterin converting factor small subunit
MAIRVEFFGIARQRAGRADLEVKSGGIPLQLQTVLSEVVQQVPGLSELMQAGRLDASLAANLDGNQFVSDPETTIQDGQSLIILSADAGG